MNMRILLLLMLLLGTINFLSAQQLELYGGINSNHLLDNLDKDGTPNSSDLTSGVGFTFGISYDNPNMNGFANRISISYNRIKSELITESTGSGLGSNSSSTYAEINKNSINVAVYPFTFIMQKVYIAFGLQANFMMSNSTTGGYLNSGSNEITDIADVSDPEFHKDLGYGVTMRAHYNIMLNNGLSIIPQYNLYYGIGEEYATAESEKIKAWQQVLAIGIGIQF